MYHVLLVTGRDTLLVTCCYSIFIYLRSWDTTTFEVNVTDDDLENSFIFDNKT